MDGILNAFHRSMSKPFCAKDFDEKVRCMLAYPRTHNIDKKDFETTSCYYTCNEKNECDFSQCLQKVNETKFENEKVSKFMKEAIEKHSKCFSTAHVFDGYIVSYKPDNESAKSIFHMINKDKQNDTRTGVIELNPTRLELIK